MTMRVGIIGAGISGLACAGALASEGASVTLFDKGRGPGGRMSSRRMPTPLGEAGFDHGAQYLKATSPAFAVQVEQWAAAGVAERWPEGGTEAWVGVPTMSAIPKHMARGLDVRAGVLVRGLARQDGLWRIIHSGGSDGPFDVAVVALPAEQAVPMLGLHDLVMARAGIAAPSRPCWAAMLAFAEPLDAPPVLRDRGIVTWAANNRSKPMRGPLDCWTLHASADWSAVHVDAEPEWALGELTRAFAKAIGRDDLSPIAAAAHRWRFAVSGHAGWEALWNPTLALGACGDWLAGPRVEAAWLSGRRLAELIAMGQDAISTDGTGGEHGAVRLSGTRAAG